MVTLYNVISSDGFIARKDGSENFIPDELWPSTLEFFKKYDALVMGRRSYEALQSYDSELLEPFGALTLQKIVLTRDVNFVPKSGWLLAHTPEEAFSYGSNTLVVSGPELNSTLVRKGVVDQVVWHTVPAVVGEGIRPFEPDIDTASLSVITEPISRRI